MYLFFVAVHIVLCTFLISVILLQPGKGSDPGSAFGGGLATSVFGPRGPTNALSQATTVTAVLFMFTSITLALYSSKEVIAGSDIGRQLEEAAQTEPVVPAEAPPTAAPPPAPDAVPLVPTETPSSP